MITTAEDIGKRSPKGGEKSFQRLPLYIKEKLTCHCKIVFNDTENTLVLPAPHDFMRVCKLCNLGHRFSIAFIYQVCEVCNNYYLPKVEDYDPEWERGKPAIRYRICSDCTGEMAFRPPAAKRSRFRIS